MFSIGQVRLEDVDGVYIDEGEGGGLGYCDKDIDIFGPVVV